DRDRLFLLFCLFFFTHAPAPWFYPLSLHDALPISANPGGLPMEVFDQIRAAVQADRSQFFKDLTVPFYGANRPGAKVSQGLRDRSEEHTSELQSRSDLVCRLLLEKKKQRP